MASRTEKTERSLQHILHHRDTFLKYQADAGITGRPLVVGISGCQGSGKTTLCDSLADKLRSKPHCLNVVNFSLDDLYLTHVEQMQLAERNPGNCLLQYRGQAGSHDVRLARTLFTQLLENTHPVSIPSYDKSLHGGLGDRLDPAAWKHADAPFDVILFEGWSLGFKALPEKELERVYQQSTQGELWKHPFEHIKVLNENLRRYESDLYPFIDIFIHLSPTRLEQVYQWRLEQEHHMKAERGVDGLSDDDVRAFVDTYMPSYELYLPRLNKVGFFGNGLHGEEPKRYEGQSRLDGGYSGHERHLRLILNARRTVVKAMCIREPSQAVRVAQKLPSRHQLVLGCAAAGALILAGYARFRQLRSMNAGS